MISYEPMSPADIFSLDIANLDSKSENFSLDYYLDYLLHHPLDFVIAKKGNQKISSDLYYTYPIIGYIFGKLEDKEKLCLHLSALSVGPSYRRFRLGSQLLKIFEGNGNSYNASFADLYVREHNFVAISFYVRNGYSVYRKVIDYYGEPTEDANDMRKGLAAGRKEDYTIRGEDINVYELM